AVEIDDIDPTGLLAEARNEVAARVGGDRRDRLGQLVRLWLAALDERDDLDARAVLAWDHPDHAIAAADVFDHGWARQLEPALRHAVLRIPFFDRVAECDHERCA